MYGGWIRRSYLAYRAIGAVFNHLMLFRIISNLDVRNIPHRLACNIQCIKFKNSVTDALAGNMNKHFLNCKRRRVPDYSSNNNA